MKKQSNKFNIILYLVVLVCVFCMFLATSYAYKNKIEKANNQHIIYNNVLMSIDYFGKNQINATNIKPGWEDSISFSINNHSKDTIGKYGLVFDIITPLSNMIDEDFVYVLEGENEKKDSTNKLIITNETVVPILTKELEGGVITPNNTHTYKLKVRINKKANPKNYLKSNLFSAKVRLVSMDN